MARKHGLGRGLGALIQDGVSVSTPATDERSRLTVPVSQLHRNSRQPRRAFEKEALDELTASIREHGILQPLLVRRAADGYELIAGERRLRAASEAGLTEVPVTVLDAPDREALELALVENLQREDLNVVEEAEGYQALATSFGMTQEQIAQRVGKARASVTNALRLLALPLDVRTLLTEGSLSAGHAKVLTGLDIPEEQVLLARRSADEGLSVRDLERLVRRARRVPRKPRAMRSDLPADYMRDLSDRLHSHLGTSVRIHPSCTYANGKKGKGTLEIDFYSNEELDRLLGMMGIAEEE